ncbi:hypothetical protein ACNKHL_21515 [Shigella flexneri]
MRGRTSGMEQNGKPFADFVWSFVNHQPQVTQATTLSEISTSTVRLRRPI